MKFLFLILAVIFSIAPGYARAEAHLDEQAFARLPVQYEGRVQPLDSFARIFLTLFSGHDSIDGQAASSWLAELLFDPDKAYKRDVFNVANPAVQQAIGLPQRENHRYDFAEIAAAMDAHKDLIASLAPAQKAQMLDPAQTQLLGLYANMLWYFEISRSLSLVLPVFSVRDAVLAQKIGVTADRPFDYMAMMSHLPAYLSLTKKLAANMPAKPGGKDMELLQLGLTLEGMEPDKQTGILRVVPPQWGKGNDTWLSPWTMLQAGQGSPQSVSLLQAWEHLAIAWRGGDEVACTSALGDIKLQTMRMARMDINGKRLHAEYFYNRAGFFPLSLVFYVTAFLAVLVMGSGYFSISYRLSFGALIGGALLHLTGLALRVYIMQRPPVATLYESILFVGLIAVMGSTVLEARNRQGVGLTIGSLAGSVLQLIAMRYAHDGDTMGPLVAVLNTNFWLGTHVVAVTTGYGCCLVTALLGHFYLLRKIMRPREPEKLRQLERLILGAALIALLFALTGTILGGIWADQSWGRFWGWDPKENGALLIVLWLLWLLHGHVSGTLRGARFAVCAALTAIVVALSWFGVNLLNVGLHSYGFTSDIALNLGAFVGLEVVIIASCFFMSQKRGMPT